MDRSRLRKEMAQKLVKHNLDVDSYLADGGAPLDLEMIDNFGNIPPEDIKWKRVKRIISFFQRAHRRFYDKSGRPVRKRPTEKQLRAIWNEPETPIDPEFPDSIPQPTTTLMVVCTENSDSGVLVVQSAKDRMRYNASRPMNRA